MKKILLFAVLLGFSLSSFAEKLEVEIEEIRPNRPNPRSLVQIPNAVVDTDTYELSIKFYSAETYTLRVVDAAGLEIRQFSVVSDGAQHPYSLGTLEEGQYTIVIEGANRSFEGGFTI